MVCTSEPPSPPQDLSVTDVQRDSVAIGWKPCRADGGADIISYIVEKRQTSKSTWSHVGRFHASVTSAEVLYLQEGQKYMIRVIAENMVGCSMPTELGKEIVPHSRYSNFMFPYCVLLHCINFLFIFTSMLLHALVTLRTRISLLFICN